jgi:hypothetical protein
MLDQSFSFENLRILFDVLNRQGKYLEDINFFKSDDTFAESRKVSNSIIEINKQIREEKKNIKLYKNNASEILKNLDALYEIKKNLKSQREEKLENILIGISTKIKDEKFKIHINKGKTKNGKQLFTIENNPENYFALKQIQRNIYKTFDVKQTNRKKVISQIKLLLSDGFPKVILRTDIKSFYETIPHRHLLNKIEENSLLSYTSKKIIKDILNQYWTILINDGIKKTSDERTGIPIGIGISAFLSELYLKDLDNLIKSIPNVSFFSRYVDDIIVIFTPENRRETTLKTNYKSEVKNIIEMFGFLMNSEKTQIVDLRKENKNRTKTIEYKINYLGYKFQILYKKSKDDNGKDKISRKPLTIRMSDNRLSKYKEKIKLAFEEFEKDIIKYNHAKSKSSNILIQRMKILTSNYRLFRRKDNVLIGIYFSNEFLTEELNDLLDLDNYIKNQIIKTNNLSTITKEKLEKISFYNGFKNKKTLNLNFNNRENKGAININRITNIWKGI